MWWCYDRDRYGVLVTHISSYYLPYKDNCSQISPSASVRKFLRITWPVLFQDALSFGRPGYGAPVRTKSGRIRTQILGNTDIRFQDNKSVRKTIDNNIRYQGDPEVKAVYHRELGEYLSNAKAVVFRYVTTYMNGKREREWIVKWNGAQFSAVSTL